MDSLPSIIHKLRHLCHLAQVAPQNVRITVEFLNPADQHYAECALRMGAQGIYADTKLIDSVVNGEPFTVMGFKFAVKRFEYPQPPTREWCNCLDCERRRAAARR